jgi:purine-binding chemotaxis protein CheW
MAELSLVPGSPEFLSGFLNVAGQVIPVISLRRLFGLSSGERHMYSPLIILKPAPEAIALEVDCGLRIAEIIDDDLLPFTEVASVNNCAAAIVRLDGESVVVLSVEQLLLEQERKRLADLARIADQRLAQLNLVTT